MSYTDYDSTNSNDSEVYDLAMKARSKRGADSQFAMLLRRQISRGVPVEVATRFLRTNLAYYAGYFDSETRGRVERLYDCQHPIFGAIAVNGAPTTDEAFQLGVNRAKSSGPQTLSELRKKKL
jgi:hypothetical protein